MREDQDDTRDFSDVTRLRGRHSGRMATLMRSGEGEALARPDRFPAQASKRDIPKGWIGGGSFHWLSVQYDGESDIWPIASIHFDIVD